MKRDGLCCRLTVDDTPDPLLPGAHLLHKTEHQRDWVGQQLAMLERSEDGRRLGSGGQSRPAAGDGQQTGSAASDRQQALGLLRTPSGSAPPRMENKPPLSIRKSTVCVWW